MQRATSEQAIIDAWEDGREFEFLGTVRSGCLAFCYYRDQLILSIGESLRIDRIACWISAKIGG